MKKILPRMKDDRAAKAILRRELSDYFNGDNFALTSFEFAPKNRSITLRISDGLLKALKMVAREQGTNYQRIVRQAIEHFLRKQAA